MGWINNFIDNYGIIAILIMIFLEYACFPVPSEVILPIAGALSINSNFLLVWLFSIIAGVCGSLVCFTFGKLGRNYIKKTEKLFWKLDASLLIYEKYQNLSVMIARIIPLFRTYISIVAGLSSQKLISFLTYSFIGIALWNFILMILGYLFYDNLDIIFKFYHEYKIIIIIFLVLIVIIYAVVKWNKRKNKYHF